MEQPPRLYHWDQEWQVHMPVGTQAMRWLKFQKQHTRATQIPPSTAAQVTCTHESNYLSLSGQQDTINANPPQNNTWEEHLQNLPTDKKWALTHLIPPEEGALVGEAI